MTPEDFLQFGLLVFIAARIYSQFTISDTVRCFVLWFFIFCLGFNWLEDIFCGRFLIIFTNAAEDFGNWDVNIPQAIRNIFSLAIQLICYADICTMGHALVSLYIFFCFIQTLFLAFNMFSVSWFCWQCFIFLTYLTLFWMFLDMLSCMLIISARYYCFY